MADLCLRSVHVILLVLSCRYSHIGWSSQSMMCFSSLNPRHLCRGVYSFRPFVRPFICSFVFTSVPFVELLQSFTCNQQNDLCTQQRLRTQWVAKSARFIMRTAKTDQTGQMPRLICVVLLRIGHFVGFVIWLLTYWMKFLVYDVLFFILP